LFSCRCLLFLLFMPTRKCGHFFLVGVCCCCCSCRRGSGTDVAPIAVIT
jgi:hypothetical protein